MERDSDLFIASMEDICSLLSVSILEFEQKPSYRQQIEHSQALISAARSCQ
ncbi:hypothetical protein OKW40_002446 [Paraburkholderia sp. RAU6.4a]|uniref:hypothetical protein n=1 Tax=Paraburkholderia sp. RAU6.4a TaxID=2991067 RepID=UPI003D1B6857